MGAHDSVHTYICVYAFTVGGVNKRKDACVRACVRAYARGAEREGIDRHTDRQSASD